MNAEVVKLVPFTDEELKEIQFTAMDRMMELNRNLKSNNHISGTAETTRSEITRLGRVVEKCSSYCSNEKP